MNKYYAKDSIKLKSPLTMEQIKKVMLDFKEFSPSGEFNPVGGELFINDKKIFEILQYAREINLKTSIVSNGTLINENVAKKIIDADIFSISISLDSHDEKIHDEIRGVKGTYKKALDAIKYLIKNRKKDTPYICLSSIIFKQNIDYLENIVELGEKLGINSISFNLLNELFGGDFYGDKDVFFMNNFFHTKEEKENAKNRIQEIFYKYKNKNIIYMKENDIKWINKYIDDPYFKISEPICGSHEKNIIVTMDGGFKLCWGPHFSCDRLNIGNVKEYSVKELWLSEEAKYQRDLMDKCRENCGAKNCHRKDDI
jgi:MoaA/NifB/PqqE/SkfB family radical SAM enzyme